MPVKLQKRNSTSKLPGSFEAPPIYLKKTRSQRARKLPSRRNRDPLRFGSPVSNLDSDSDSNDTKGPLGLMSERPRLAKGPSSVGFLASSKKAESIDSIDVEKELAKMKDTLGSKYASLDYSDFEEDDVTSAATKSRDVPGWSPDFLRRHKESEGSSTTSQRTAIDVTIPPAFSSDPPEGAVPVTSSLIKALDRLALAQQAAFGTPKLLRPGLPPTKSSEVAAVSGLPKPQFPVADVQDHPGAQWDSFWKDVKVKAGR